MSSTASGNQSRRLTPLRVRQSAGRTAVALALLVGAFCGSGLMAEPAQRKTTPAHAKSAGASPLAKTQALPEVKQSGPLALQYCQAVREAAVEARFAFQVAKIEELKKELDDRLAKIDARGTELKQWLAKRDEFSRKATEHLVGVFSAMRPEAASEQLVRLEPLTAAAILAKLDSRAASAILNDMTPEKAAGLASIIAGSARHDQRANRP